jgi:outer membrane receptor for ferrienterochelin and colicin
MLKRILYLLSFVLIADQVMAQVTTSNITGIVKGAKGEALVGATVIATHVPTGTNYTTNSRVGGRFDLNNLNPGGPYTINITYVGYQPFSRPEIFLNLGETARQDFELSTSEAQLSEVVVSSSRRPAGSKGGAETNIGRDKIANLPTVGRNLNDFVRYTPQVKITSTGGISIAGQNNRFNSFMIDGAVNNDVFGVSDQATNGGRAGVPPLSIDAIDQIVVQISPYDASIGNFTGAGINAITRSGTNTFTGSIYGFYRNKNLVRKELNGVRLGKFENQTFGFRVGGPIIKNKLFYFINAELQDDNRPQTFDISTYRGNSGNRIGELVTFLKNKYQYDPGDYIDNPDIIKRKNINTKIDWNIDPKNKLSLSYRLNDAERTNPSRSSTTAINFFNGAEFFPSVTHSGTAELNTRFANNKTNLLRATYTRVRDDRAITGSPFPNVSIRDGSNINIVFGSEISSTANLLKQSIFNIYDAFKLNLNKHSFTFGTDNDFTSTYNLFINRNFGFYEYNSLDDFLTEKAARRYRRGYSLADPVKQTGDLNEGAAADFNSYRLGFFANDDIKFNDQFTLTIGIRGDYFNFRDKPVVDPFFRDSASKIISPLYDLEGAETGEMFDPKISLSPRIGFRYTIPDENVTVRGGIGIFTGRTPLVWPGGAFQQTAVTIGAIDTTRSAGLLLNGQPLQFRSDINNQYSQSDFGLPANLLIPQGELTLISKDYRVPSIIRTSLAFDKKVSNDWTFSLEGILSKNLNEVDWTNVNLIQPTVQTDLIEDWFILLQPTRLLSETGLPIQAFETLIQISFWLKTQVENQQALAIVLRLPSIKLSGIIGHLTLIILMAIPG